MIGLLDFRFTFFVGGPGFALVVVGVVPAPLAADGRLEFEVRFCEGLAA